MNLTIPLASLAALSALILTWQKIVKNSKKISNERDLSILQAAKEEDQLLKAKLEARIEKIDAQLKNLELNVNKDISHLKDVYSSEIRALSEKIENLRQEIQTQHSQMVDLLSKLINNKP